MDRVVRSLIATGMKNGSYLAAGSENGAVRVWYVNDDFRSKDLPRAAGKITGVEWSLRKAIYYSARHLTANHAYEFGRSGRG